MMRGLFSRGLDVNRGNSKAQGLRGHEVENLKVEKRRTAQLSNNRPLAHVLRY